MHYKNGREAKVGDPVVGKTYNTNGAVISGTLISLTPGPDSCSCEVGYLSVVRSGRVAQPVLRVSGSEQHGSAGPLVAVEYRSDYSECKNLLHANDVLNALPGEVPDSSPKD